MSQEPRFLTVKTYAEKCGISLHAVYQRIYKSEDGKVEEGSRMYLEQTLIDEVEGIFIDSKKFPPVRIRKTGGGRKKIIKSKE